MIEPAHARIADTAPIAPNRPVQMAKEQVTNARCMRRDNVVERFCVVHHDCVHGLDPDLKRRVMHEQEDRARRLQLAGQSIAALVAVGPGMAFGSLRVEQQETPARRLNHLLHKAIFVTRQVRKCLHQRPRVVVIADHKMEGDL